MGSIESRIGEIEFDLLEGEKTTGQIARDNGFADFGAMGQWLVDQRQIQLWRELQAKARRAGVKVPDPKPASRAPTPQPARPAEDPAPPPPSPEEPMEQQDTQRPTTWAQYIETALKSPKKRTVAKAQKVRDLIDDLKATVDDEASEVEALRKIEELEKQLAAEKAKIKKPAKKTASSKPDSHAAEVRAWAKDNGFDVPDRGRMSPDVHAAYDEAHQ